MSGYATCPACKGNGEVSGGYCPCCDSNIDLECLLCSGVGEVRADVAVDYLEREVQA